ncbi:hypothetical protein ACIBF1_30575 [Spirillospora sp. NPDC050679]
MFERQRLQTERMPEDLHYRLKDADTGEVVAVAEPVAVGEAKQASGFKRFLRAIPQPLAEQPVVSQYVPRITLRVADAQGATVLFVDRAPKILDHPYPPQHTALDARGTVLGAHVPADFSLSQIRDGRVDADGMTVIEERGHLRGPDRAVLAVVSARLPMTEQASQALQRPDCELARYTGADGTLWARALGPAALYEFNPGLPPAYRALVIASMLAGRLDERIIGFLDPGLGMPEQRRPAGEPYPGFALLHDFHLREQEEWIATYKKERNRLRN